MSRYLSQKYGLNSAEVGIVLGSSMKYDIAEVVDPMIHIVARLPKSTLGDAFEAIARSPGCETGDWIAPRHDDYQSPVVPIRSTAILARRPARFSACANSIAPAARSASSTTRR